MRMNEWMNENHMQKEGETEADFADGCCVTQDEKLSYFSENGLKDSKVNADSQSQNVARLTRLHIYPPETVRVIIGPTSSRESGRNLSTWWQGQGLLSGDLHLCPLEQNYQLLPDFPGPGPIDDRVEQTWKQQEEGAEEVVHILGGTASHTVDNGWEHSCRNLLGESR